MSRLNMKSVVRLKSSLLRASCRALSTQTRPFPVLGDNIDASTTEASKALIVAKTAEEDLHKIMELRNASRCNT